MSPETDRFLQKAEKHLERGHVMLSVGLNTDEEQKSKINAFR